MIICENCGKIYDEDDVGTYLEAHGERRGEVCSCGGELVEAVHCEICDEYIPEGEHICYGCYDNGITVENAVKLGEEQPIYIPINEFIAHTLPVKDINYILIQYIYDNYTDKSKEVRDYLELDPTVYEDFLIEESAK